MSRRRFAAAFTLVELLVVIGIIAVLISILLPTLARARQSAQSVACLSNLRQIGQVAMLYANESHGALPQPCPAAQKKIPGSSPQQYHATADAPYRFSMAQAEILDRLMRGGTKVWYCPSNEFNPPAGQPEIADTDFYPPAHGGVWVSAPITSGRIKYWWVANPGPPDYTGPLTEVPAGSGLFWASNAPGAVLPYGAPAYCDTNRDGSIRDEYMRKVGDKNAPSIVNCTDQSGQFGGAGWYFIHGKGETVPTNAPTSDRAKLTRSWKNNLYGDGHAETKRPDECMVRWAPNSQACW
jgi:prepilin-type N-terminal cleavage/methylation domain-containing protein